jgi:hypothetical protein
VETRSSVNPASVEPEPKSKTGGFIGSTWPEVVVDKLACFLLEQLFVSLLQMGHWGYGEPMCVFDVCCADQLTPQCTEIQVADDSSRSHEPAGVDWSQEDNLHNDIITFPAQSTWRVQLNTATG